MHLMLSKKGSATYATAAESVRVDGKPVKTNRVYLGRVVDLEGMVFENRERGVFTYDLETGEFGTADIERIPPKPRGKRRLVLDFGDAYVLDRHMRDMGLYDCLDGFGVRMADTIKALTSYYVLSDEPNSHASVWFEGSYASLLYPEAEMDGRRITEFLRSLGTSDLQSRFFRKYIGMICGNDPTAFIVDSTGAPNAAHMPITAVSNHNGEINNEVRIILVCRKSDRMPIFVRYVPGNVLDSTTLSRTMDEMRAMKVNLDYAILDAGYCTLENIHDLVNSHIGFITRLKPNYELYKNMVSEHVSDLDVDRRVIHNNRFLRILTKEHRLEGTCRNIYLHLILDENTKAKEELSAFRRRQEGRITDDELRRCYETAGLFVLVSSFWMDVKDVAPTYYERGGIEQLIDVGKGESHLGEVAVHSEEVFRGKLLLEFMALAVNQSLQNRFRNRKAELSERKRKHKENIPAVNMSPHFALMALRNQKCDVYESVILPRERNRIVNEVYALFGYESPRSLDIP